jgi:hypothetical protein
MTVSKMTLRLTARSHPANEVIGHSGIYSSDPQHMLAFDAASRILTADYQVWPPAVKSLTHHLVCFLRFSIEITQARVIMTLPLGAKYNQAGDALLLPMFTVHGAPSCRPQSHPGAASHILHGGSNEIYHAARLSDSTARVQARSPTRPRARASTSTAAGSPRMRAGTRGT